MIEMILVLTCEVWSDTPVSRIRRKSQTDGSLRTYSIKERVKHGILLERNTSVEYLSQGLHGPAEATSREAICTLFMRQGMGGGVGIIRTIF